MSGNFSVSDKFYLFLQEPLSNGLLKESLHVDTESVVSFWGDSWSFVRKGHNRMNVGLFLGVES